MPPPYRRMPGGILEPQGTPPPPATPAAPVADAATPARELRALRQRSRDLAESSRRDAARPWMPQSPKVLLTIYDGGHLPAEAEMVYLGRPTQVDADDQEGATPTFAADPDQSVPVVVLGRPARPGDILVAALVGGRWVAEKMGRTCDITIVIAGCGPVPGATVEIRDAGGNAVYSGTTDASGELHPDIPTDTYDFSIAAPGYPDAEVDGADIGPIGCGTNVVPIALSDDDGDPIVVCCDGTPIPKTLYLTDFAGTIPLDFLDGPETISVSWGGMHDVQSTQDVVTSFCGSTSVPANCTTGTGKTRIFYTLTCIPGPSPRFLLRSDVSYGYADGASDAGDIANAHCPGGGWIGYESAHGVIGIPDYPTLVLELAGGVPRLGSPFVVGDFSFSLSRATATFTPDSLAPFAWSGTLDPGDPSILPSYDVVLGA